MTADLGRDSQSDSGRSVSCEEIEILNIVKFRFDPGSLVANSVTKLALLRSRNLTQFSVINFKHC